MTTSYFPQTLKGDMEPFSRITGTQCTVWAESQAHHTRCGHRIKIEARRAGDVISAAGRSVTRVFSKSSVPGCAGVCRAPTAGGGFYTTRFPKRSRSASSETEQTTAPRCFVAVALPERPPPPVGQDTRCFVEQTRDHTSSRVGERRLSPSGVQRFSGTVRLAAARFSWSLSHKGHAKFMAKAATHALLPAPSCDHETSLFQWYRGGFAPYRLGIG